MLNRIYSKRYHPVSFLVLAIFACSAYTKLRAKEVEIIKVPFVNLKDTEAGEVNYDSDQIVVALYTTSGMPAFPLPNQEIKQKNSPHKVILLVFNDGRIVWSSDPIKGGPPFLSVKISPDRINKFFSEVAKQEYADQSVVRQHHYGPDASYTTLYVMINDEHVIAMKSWHELAEQNQKIAATSKGLQSLGGRDRSNLLSQDTEEYRLFRNAWADLRQRLKALRQTHLKDFVADVIVGPANPNIEKLELDDRDAKQD